MNISPEGWAGLIGAVIAIGMLAERIRAALAARAASPPAQERTTTLPPQPAAVSPPALVVPPAMVQAVSPHRGPYITGDECAGCAVLSGRVDTLAQQLAKVETAATEIKSMLDQAKGERAARRQMALETIAQQGGKVVVDGRESGTG
jgi:hypothetical protein